MIVKWIKIDGFGSSAIATQKRKRAPILSSNVFVDSILSLLRRGKIARAKREIQQQSQTVPKHIFHECNGHVSFFEAEFQNAIDHYERAIRLCEERVISRYQVLVGIGYVQEEDYGNAFRRYEGAMRADPDLVEAYEAMAELMTIIGEKEAALKFVADAHAAAERLR